MMNDAQIRKMASGEEILGHIRNILSGEYHIESVMTEDGPLFNTMKVTVNLADGSFMTVYMHHKSPVRGKIFK